MSPLVSVPALKSMTLRPKLMLAFTAMAFLAGICGSVGLVFVDRIGVTVSTYSDVTSPLLAESKALLENALRMRSSVFRGVSEGDNPDVVAQSLSRLDAVGRRHLQILGKLATQAEIGIPLEPIE